MNRKIVRILSTFFFIICAVILAILNIIPRGNFIAGPTITLFIYVPLLIIQLFLLIRVWTEKITIKALKRSVYFSLFIVLIFICFFIHFLKTTS